MWLSNFQYQETPFSVSWGENVTFNNGDASAAFGSRYGLTGNINIPEGTNKTYRMFDYCNHFNSMVYMPNYIDNVNSMFRGADNFNQPVHIPNYNDGNNLFCGCRNLNALVTFDNNIENLIYTFYTCYGFDRNITLPSNVKYMTNTFEHCNSFNQNITIPNGVLSMNATFKDCHAFDQNIHIPDSVTSMYGTFYECRNLTQDIHLPSNLIIGDTAFAHCGNFNHNVQLPSSMTSASSMFSVCSNLDQQIVIPSSVEGVGGMFSWCVNLDQNIQLPSSAKWASGMFESCYKLNQNISLDLPNLRGVANIFRNCGNMNMSCVTFGPSCNELNNALANTKMRRATLKATYYNAHDILSIFSTVLPDEQLDLSGFTPMSEDNMGDVLYQINIPSSARIYYRNYRADYPVTAIDHTILQAMFGGRYNTFNYAMWQPMNADDYVLHYNNGMASIYWGGFNEDLNSHIAVYADWNNIYFDSEYQVNTCPRYACLLTLV